MIDLHLHSNHSDGTWTPEEVVSNAAGLEFSTIALTDHDNVSGLAEAIRAGKEKNVEVIPGIEITSYHRGVETHILGYFIDYEDSDFLKILKQLTEFRNSAITEMVALLNNQSYTINIDDVIGTSISGYIGRPHVARALCDNGFIPRIQDAFDGGPIGDDGDCFVRMSDLSAEDAIGVITDAGGLPVIAHPGAWPNPGNCFPDNDIHELKKVGLAGIECAHPRHSADIRQRFESIADELEMIKTGGSDCHGEYYDPVKMGSVTIPPQWLADLKSRL